ncbi:hypothetical protein FB555_001159 [Alpinimonas psychrophila]|uniref:Uncharacterized protein n=1 Tax=Alpinimonas psychrophila TaxID=748908 RepID=A0A7W3JTN0_9MICO|nr:hypothetical protein [Alpinimonas psychrophila]
MFVTPVIFALSVFAPQVSAARVSEVRESQELRTQSEFHGTPTNLSIGRRREFWFAMEESSQPANFPVLDFRELGSCSSRLSSDPYTFASPRVISVDPFTVFLLRNLENAHLWTVQSGPQRHRLACRL